MYIHLYMYILYRPVARMSGGRGGGLINRTAGLLKAWGVPLTFSQIR